MKHYDLRVIEDCLVFSYEVEGPSYPKKPEAEAERYVSSHLDKKKKKHKKMMRSFLNILLYILMPFAFLLDRAVDGIRAVWHGLHEVFRCRIKYLPVFSTLSSFFLLTVILFYV